MEVDWTKDSVTDPDVAMVVPSQDLKTAEPSILQLMLLLAREFPILYRHALSAKS